MADKVRTESEPTEIGPNRPRVFVYGTLKHGRGNHRALKGANFLGRVRLTGPYTMVNMGWFPGIIENPEVKAGYVFGEVYEITDEILHTLDLIEGHPNFYTRKKISTPFKNAWCYFLPKSYLDKSEQVPNGIWNPTDDEARFVVSNSEVDITGVLRAGAEAEA